MSTGHVSRHPSQSARSQGSRASGRDGTGAQAQTTTAAPQLDDVAHAFKPAAATASFFLHAQHNVIFCLHHDTLAVERRFERHNEDILLIAADNVSERGAGRLVVSYDASLTAIVWDLFTGDEVARFASYEPIYVATWMRDGTIAFGNAQGSIILFDPHTSEHQAARTIFDPVTALAPAADCKTFAIGYLNGSILIATLQPFTILHTLNTSRGPSPITGLAWHGSSSKQKTEMLATQTSDGDLRVWSIAKPPVNEAPRIIRILGAPEIQTSTKSWFAWSKNGRIIQYTDDETRSWDVRTKKVSHAHVPTISAVTGVTNYGPTATLFTIGPEQSIQQYDLNPNGQPTMVANVQHAPANAPPTPPDSAPRETPPPIEPPTVPLQAAETSSEDEGPALSPLQKIAQEMDQIEEEMRDRVGPLSPVSSRASSRASMSSAGSYGRKSRSRPRDRAYSSRASDNGSEHTAFSMGSTMHTGRESMSIRSMSSATSSRYHGGSSRYLTPKGPPPQAEPQGTRDLDLFPYVRARLSEVKFRTPQFGSNKLTPDVLRREMLSVVFGWEDDIEPLIRLEMAQHMKGTAGRVLLGKWLGDDGSDQLAEMMASQSMTSTDWMLLAMTSQMGQGSQKQVGEAFVRRLLETDEIHPAVAIMLGLNEPNEAVEAYVSRKCFMEAVLLTCLYFPNDWQRQSYLLRKWGETTVAHGQAELAVRCFSCTSVDTSEPWFSPGAQNEVQAAQQSLAAMASPTSPPSAGPSIRVANKNAGLTKLVTTFEKPSSRTKPLNPTVGVTPIIDSAISPGAEKPWKRSHSRGLRDPSADRTATPGGYNRRRGLSADPGARSALDADATPLVGRLSRPGSRMSGKETPATAVKSRMSDALPSPAPGTFNSNRARSRHRDASKDRNHNGLQIQMMRTEEADEPAVQTASTSQTHKSMRSTATSSREGFSPLLTDGSSASIRGRHIDRYIDSLSQANQEAEQLRAENRSRTQSRDGRSHSQARRRRADSSSQSDVSYIKPSKRSPSSPAAMHTDDAFKYQGDSRDSYDRTDSSELASPVESKSSRVRASSRSTSQARGNSRAAARRAESPDDSNRLRSANKAAAARVASRSRHRLPSPERQDSGEDRGRGHSRKTSHGAPRSPSSPSPMSYDNHDDDNTSETIMARRRRQRSTSRRADDRRADDRSTTRARSSSRKPTKFTLEEPWSANPDRTSGEFTADDPKSPASSRTSLSRKQLAQKELEERRLSLARRQPSVPPVPHPSEYSSSQRPSLSPRALSNDAVATLSTAAYGADPVGQRSRTAEPETAHSRSKSAMPSIGLPATPRAMRHPRYMSAEPDERDAIPAVPALPEGFASAQSQQQATAGALESPPTDGAAAAAASLLLPSSVYGQKGGAAPLRSASAPPEQQQQQARARAGSVRSHARRPSKDAAVAEEPAAAALPPPPAPVVLPELQHLAIPPPPPPPPAPPSGVINISLDGSAPPPTDPTSASSPPPSSGRRGRGSVSGDAVSGLFKSVRERMRADSRSRAKSPPTAEGAPLSFTPSPYETKLPGQWGAGAGSGSSAASPALGKGEYTTTPPLPPPPPPVPQVPALLAQAGKSSPPRVTGYRNPKEIQRQYVDGAGRI